MLTIKATISVCIINAIMICNQSSVVIQTDNSVQLHEVIVTDTIDNKSKVIVIE